MRVLVISFGFIDHSIQLANAVSRTGTRVGLILPEVTSPLFDPYAPIDPEIDLMRFHQPRFYSPLNLPLLFRIYRKCVSFQPGIIHFQEIHPWCSLIVPFLRRKGYRVITTLHDPVPHLGENSLRARISKFSSLRLSDRILVHGKRLRELLVQESGYPRDRIGTIPIGEHQVSPFLRYARSDLTEDEGQVLFFGRIYGYKGLDYLIRAEPLISREVPGVRIVIAGAGEDIGKYRRMMVNPGHFLVKNYPISYREGAELFQTSSIVVLPYVEASQSGVIPTAYGFKKPLVVTDVGAIPEIVDQGVTGLVVPPRDPSALAGAVIRLLKDPKLRKEMGEAGYRKLKTDLAWDSIAPLLLKEYELACR
jgi:alpha-maltose-1-phosphate synthase